MQQKDVKSSMDRIQKIILISIISIAAISWILSIDQPDMMAAMMNYNPIAISLFTVSWTIGMAAMMFPAIVPMVLLYNRMIKNSGGNSSGDNTLGEGISPSQTSVFAERDDEYDTTVKGKKRTSLSSLLSNVTNSINIIFFVGSYLLVWAITGIILLSTWSIPVHYFLMHLKTNQIQLVYGVILVISGVYQFSSLKTKCLGYCESPKFLYEKIEEWNYRCTKDGNISWSLLSWLLLAVFSSYGSFRLDEFVMDGIICWRHI
jgi:predicted metal-binding membrane protein